MHFLATVFAGYRRIERPILWAIAAQFCIQAVNTAFFLLLNYYMDQEGFADYEIAEVLSYRFLAVFWLAFPIGLLIKGRRLKPFFWFAAFSVPVFSNLMILAIGQGWTTLLNWATVFWGIGYTCMQITILPFILLNAKPSTHSEAFSLSFLSFSGTICITGVLYTLLHNGLPAIFDERMVLQLVAISSGLAIWFIAQIRIREKHSDKIGLQQVMSGYDWGAIFRALIPTFIIAIGAGFTIPVINLFFLNIHGVESELFSILGATTYFLVAGVMLFMPFIKRRFGYRIAITLFQSMAVFALFMLATTEYYRDWSVALPVAIFFYIIRQPLMNAAGPMTSELVMYYVGKKNQEIMSALNASIWSGSWFISMKLFGWMRQQGLPYVQIFLITVLLYACGVTWYAFLIRSYRRRTGNTGKAIPSKLPPVQEQLELETSNQNYGYRK